MQSPSRDIACQQEEQQDGNEAQQNANPGPNVAGIAPKRTSSVSPSHAVMLQGRRIVLLLSSRRRSGLRRSSASGRIEASSCLSSEFLTRLDRHYWGHALGSTEK